MGLFSPAVRCAVCVQECGMRKIEIANKEWCCSNCFGKIGYAGMTPIKALTPETIRQAIQRRAQDREKLAAFTVTKEVAPWFKVDENRREWYVADGFFGGTNNPIIHSFDDIVDYELLENGNSVTKGGLGSAVAGGLLFGGVGAVVGGVTGKRKTNATCTSMRVKITVNDMTHPIEYVNLINAETNKNGFIYTSSLTQAQQIISLLELICASNRIASQQTHVVEEQQVSTADELMKFKQLLDAGAITAEEFAAQKKRLLGL